MYAGPLKLLVQLVIPHQFITYICTFFSLPIMTYPKLISGITFPSGEVQRNLLLEVYKEARVDPENIGYIEAHGTGTKAGDPQELNAIVEVFCRDSREGPLLIGSTKSNMGHPEPASGIHVLCNECNK